MTVPATPSRWTRFADPYKECVSCGGWIDGARDGRGPIELIPCGHRDGYNDVCPSWSPVDGCRCAEFTAAHPDNPIRHRMRQPEPGDDRTY